VTAETAIPGGTTHAGRDRQRTYTWEDPRLPAAELGGRSGLDLLRAIAHGELAGAPIAATLGMTVLEVDEGRVVFGLTPDEYHYNPIGSVHGGVHATLLDSAMGCAVHSRLGPGQGYTTLDISVRYLRPVTVGSGDLRCEGRVMSMGSRVATAEGSITDSRGKLVATGTTTCLVMSTAG
jgi:uncharacterized protein (TIGR00369 family)